MLASGVCDSFALLHRIGRRRLVRRALPPLAVVVLVRPHAAELVLRAECLLVRRDRTSLLLNRRLRQRDNLLVRVLRHVLCLRTRSVPLLRLLFRGNTISLVLYNFRRLTFSCKPSVLRFLRRWSTVMPTVRAHFFGMPASLSSTSVNPRPV